MNDATPKSDYAPKTKEERLKGLSDFDDNLLKDTIVLLSQLKRAGVGKYGTPEYEIKGLSNSDITWAIFSINPLYRDLEKEQNKNEHLQNNPVFYLSGFTEGSENYAERVFMVGPQLDLALSEIKEVLDRKNTYLNLINEEFFYNDKKLKIDPETLLYQILRKVYDYFRGKSGEIVYKDLFEELRKINKIKHWSNEKLKVKIRQDLTSKTMGLGKHIKNTEKNGVKLFETRNGKGLLFNNQKVSE